MKKIDDNKIINCEELKLKEDKGIDITCDCCKDEEQEEEMRSVINPRQDIMFFSMKNCS